MAEGVLYACRGRTAQHHESSKFQKLALEKTSWGYHSVFGAGVRPNWCLHRDQEIRGVAYGGGYIYTRQIEVDVRTLRSRSQLSRSCPFCRLENRCREGIGKEAEMVTRARQGPESLARFEIVVQPAGPQRHAAG